ncbi:MAG TPA: LysR family transcriptional regulator [Kofleriaceae bacterium]|jgi:DNA-binding transcriptional LysR family regulator|nr:LysR family transcriptional regulator [Kofleriaceae bacterium]
MDRLATIEAFVEAAQRGSFTLAARHLQLSPSALSRRIASLEAQLGVRLFHRTTRALRLSDDGRAFFERARDALRELAEAAAATSGLRDRPAGLLRVEAPTILGRNVVVPAIQRLVARHPDVRVELALRDHALDLASHGIDVAIRLGTQPDSALVARKIGTTRMGVYGARSYFRRAGRPRTPADLEHHHLLGLAVHGRVVPWRLRDGDTVRERVPDQRILVDSADALVELAASGAGLAWLCDFMKLRQPLLEVLRGAACAESAVHVVSLPSRHVLPKVRVFIELVEAGLARAT